MASFTGRDDFTAEYQRLASRLSALQAGCSLVVSDMTSTLINQGPGGFPERTRLEIIRFLEAGGKFLLVTGDTHKVIEEEFFKRLRYDGARPVYVISAAGYLIYEWRREGMRELHRGQPLARAAREAAFGVIEQLMAKLFSAHFRFSAAQMKCFFDGDGCRLDISGALAVPGIRMLVEGVPSKVTVVFPNSVQAQGKTWDFLKELASDPALRQLSALENFHIVLGGNFVDIISARKEDGLEVFFNLPEGRALEIGKCHVVAMGDSPNDKGVLNFCYPALSPVVRVFVGNDETFVREEIRDSASADFFFLKDSFIAGSLFVLSNLRS